MSEPDERFLDYGISTSTSREQIKVEKMIEIRMKRAHSEVPLNLKLNREKHVHFLRRSLLDAVNPSCLDASRAWIVYWSLHSLELLDIDVGEEGNNIVEFLNLCQNADGGFGGGPGQMSHLAPTYAAVCALAIVGTKEAYEAINRKTLLSFLWKMRTDEGTFTMHENGEVDIRGVYCAVSVARLTNIYSEELFRDTAQWIMRCQTYEGGFSGAPGLEAHGGYTFCGLAALTFLQAQHLCHTQSLLRWAVNRQMRFEGGFQGRTNKLVDGCYSFWQGGIFPILHSILSTEELSGINCKSWLFHQEALQKYLLLYCQHPNGGLIDKPGKCPDIYHTCYTLSGLSVAQHFAISKFHEKSIVGDESNELAPVHTLYNIGVHSAIAASQYFSKLPTPTLTPQEKGKR